MPGTDPLTRMVGRAEERRRLDSLLDHAAGGAYRAAVLRGQPGVGKSVLLRDLGVRARARGFTVLTAAGVESESDSELPYWGLAELISPVADSIDALPEAQAAALQAALDLGPPRSAERFAVYLGFRLLLLELADRAPLLLVVDDAQWVDSGTLEALRFAARRTEDAPLGVIVAVREGEGRAVEIEEAYEMEIVGLDESSSVTLLEQHAPGIAAPVAIALHRACAGNPLALVELAQNLPAGQLAGQAPLPEPLPVGRRLERGFARRAGALSTGTQQALLLAAASASGSMDLIAAALAREGIRAQVLHDAEAAGLLEIVGGSVRWRHTLVRSAILHAATPPDRRAAHRALAQVAGDGHLADHRAWHLAAAAEGPDEAAAVELESLAEYALARGALATATRALSMAAGLTSDGKRRAKRLLAAAEATIPAGDGSAATRLLDQAMHSSRDAGTRAQAELLRARVDLLGGTPELAHHRLVAAATAHEGHDPGLASRMMSEAAVSDMALGNRERYMATAVRALEIARRAAPGSEALPGLLMGLGMLADGQGDPALELMSRHRALAEQPALWSAAPEIAAMFALGHSWVGRHDEAHRLVGAMIAAGRERGAVRALALPLAVQADVHFRTGNWPAALASATEATRMAEDTGENALFANNLAYLARIEAVLGRVTQAREHATHVLNVSRALGINAVAWYARHAVGLISLSTGDYEDAVRALGQMREWPTWDAEPGLSLWRADLVESLVRLGRRDEAVECLASLRVDTARTGRVHGQAVVARLDGMLADDDFDEPFATAAAAHAVTGMPFESARTELLYGERLRRARRRREAREKLAGAHATFAGLGATIWTQRALRELEAAGARTPAPARGSAWEALTAGERSVVQVILEGATYRETAERLHLSPRTVESHLRQAYRKLGVRSRSELTLRLGSAERGPESAPWPAQS